jgi:CheY-like chemotaxis protein
LPSETFVNTTCFKFYALGAQINPQKKADVFRGEKMKNTLLRRSGAEKEAFNGRSILVVDDQVNLLDIVSRMLSASGFDVQTASNGYQALRLCSRSCFALVLTDFNMPGMDGLALAEKIKRASPDTPVIMMTGADGPELKKIKESRCVARLMRKPFRWEDLNEAVANALAGNPDLSVQRLMPNPNASRPEGQYRIQPIPNPCEDTYSS